MLDSGQVAFVHGGVAVGVGTRDANRRPEFTRGWGPELSADGRWLSLSVIAPLGSRTRENLRDNGAIAVSFGLPTMARALQVKGVATDIGDPEPAELDRAKRHLGAFAAQLERLGTPERIARRTFAAAPSDFVAVRFSIDEAFDQTPGPKAGQRL